MDKLIIMKNIIKLCLFLLLFNSCNFAPGSYPYAETYKINLSEEELIEVINKFKESNTEYIMGLEYSLTDRRSSHWYHIYFKNLKKIEYYIYGLVKYLKEKQN